MDPVGLPLPELDAGSEELDEDVPKNEEDGLILDVRGGIGKVGLELRVGSGEIGAGIGEGV